MERDDVMDFKVFVCATALAKGLFEENLFFKCAPARGTLRASGDLALQAVFERAGVMLEGFKNLHASLFFSFPKIPTPKRCPPNT